MLTALEQILAATRVSPPEPKTRATGWLNDSSISVRILDTVKDGHRKRAQGGRPEAIYRRK